MTAAPATETVAFRMRIDPEQAMEYRRRHDAIWSELAEALLAAGVIDYRIFLAGDNGDLFAVLTRRSDHDLDALPARPVMRRWWAMMDDLMPTDPEGAPESTPLEEVFRLSAPGEESQP